MGTSTVKLGLPKGSLENATIELFRKAGWRITVSSRSYFPTIDDEQIACSLVRAQEMSRYVENGVLDAGLTGLDWILENDSDVEVVCDLIYAKATARKVRWVLAVREEADINTLEECRGKTISTELVNYTRRYFAERNIPVKVEFSWGATEAKVVEGLVDAIVEITETGSTLRANGLKIIHTFMESDTKLIANKGSIRDPAKRDKIVQIALLLKGALNAENMVGLKMNVSKAKIDTVVGILPSLKAPTVAELYKTDWLSLETVIRESTVRDLIPQLINIGADGIIEYPLNKIVNRDDSLPTNGS